MANQRVKVSKIAEEIELKKKELQQEKTLLHILQQLYTKQQGQQQEDHQRQLIAEQMQQQLLAYQEQMKDMIRGVRDGTVVNPQQQFTSMFALQGPPGTRAITTPTKRRAITTTTTPAPPAPALSAPPSYLALTAGSPASPGAMMEIDEWSDDEELSQKMKGL